MRFPRVSARRAWFCYPRGDGPVGQEGRAEQDTYLRAAFVHRPNLRLVGIGCGPLYADDGDVSELRDTLLCGHFEQASRSLDVYLVGLAERARRTVNYGIDACTAGSNPSSMQRSPFMVPGIPLRFRTSALMPSEPRRSTTRRPSTTVPPVTRTHGRFISIPPLFRAAARYRGSRG